MSGQDSQPEDRQPEDRDPRHLELVDWLESQGHTHLQIQRILSKVTEYDNQTLHESIFDSIDSGDFDIASLIDEALSDESSDGYSSDGESEDASGGS